MRLIAALLFAGIVVSTEAQLVADTDNANGDTHVASADISFPNVGLDVQLSANDDASNPRFRLLTEQRKRADKFTHARSQPVRQHKPKPKPVRASKPTHNVGLRVGPKRKLPKRQEDDDEDPINDGDETNQGEGDDFGDDGEEGNPYDEETTIADTQTTESIDTTSTSTTVGTGSDNTTLSAVSSTTAVSAISTTASEVNSTTAKTKSCTYSGELASLKRAFHQPSIDHLYTTDENEISTLSQRGWRIEGTAGFLGRTDDATNCGGQLRPLHRLYLPPRLDHLLTIWEEEKQNAMNRLGYTFESIIGYCASTPVCGATQPLMRYYNALGTDHFYTVDQNEVNVHQATKHDFWKFESIACYVWPTASAKEQC